MKNTIELLKEADKAYYNTDQTTMSDEEYDTLKDTLQKEDPTNEYFKEVGSKIIAKIWNKHTHKIKMGSLFKSQNLEELSKDFLNRHIKNKQEFIVMEKYDGLSLSLEYDNGTLIHAVTRGDGIIGEDILENVLKMNGVEKNIKGFTGSLRAEIVLPVSSFNMINEELSDDKQMSNPRNAASGIARKKFSENVRFLEIKYFNIDYPTLDFKTEMSKLYYIEDKLGIKRQYDIITDKETIKNIYSEYINNKRNNLDLPLAPFTKLETKP